MKNNIVGEVITYITDAVALVKPVWAFFMSVVSYVLFPDKAFIPAAIALVGATILDIITRYYALSVNNQGFRNAVKTHVINSENFWTGTRKKIIGYLVVMILSGLSVRITPLTQIAVFMATFAYSIMFLRESQSVIENLIDAGHSDLEWFLFWVKKKQENILQQEGLNEGGAKDELQNKI